MLHQGGLAGAGMSDDADKLSPLHAEGHFIQSLMLKGCSRAVQMGKISDL